jgi:isoleucyl-tRNA synthetase
VEPQVSEQQFRRVYPLVDMTGAESGATGTPSFPRLEEQVLAYWKDDDTFRASIENRSDSDEFVFYDGPPFANGLPHYGHLLTGYVKDLVPRFQTMRGTQASSAASAGTAHGLPAELEAEQPARHQGQGRDREVMGLAEVQRLLPGAPSCKLHRRVA